MHAQRLLCSDNDDESSEQFFNDDISSYNDLKDNKT